MNAHNEQQARALAELTTAAGLMLSEIDTRGHEVDPAYRATLFDAWEQGKAALAASPAVKQNLTTQPAAAQEPVGWQWRWLDTDNTWSEWTDGGSRKEIDARIARWKADGEDHRMQVRPVFAAPVTAAPYSIDADPLGIRATVADCITGTLMVGAQGHTKPPEGHWLLPFWEMARADARASTPAAPGIDLADVSLAAQMLTWGREEGLTEGQIAEIDAHAQKLFALIEQADASPKGALNEQFGSAEGFKAHLAEFIKLGRRHVTALYNSPRDEISMTDTGDWIQYASQLLQLDSPEGGSEAREAARYRWLRDLSGNAPDDTPSVKVFEKDLDSWWYIDGPKLDAAIDAAMQAQAGDAEVQP